MDDLDATLTRLRALVPALGSQDTIQAAAEPFCDEFYRLYRLVRAGMPRAEYSRVLEFLRDSTETMKFALNYLLQDLVNRIEDMLEASFQALEWITICEMRSTFEALIELYGDYMPVVVLSPDTDEMDDMLERKGKTDARIHPDLTPTDFPDDHWWWEMD